jgi:Carboxypeptidase regulatory-like domain
MRFRPRRLLLSAFLLAISFARELNAQTTTSGAVTGVVTDPSHAVVPDAHVEIEDNAKGTSQATKTDQDGVYRFFFLAPGSYTLTITRNGFREERRAVNVLLGPAGTVNVTLEIAKERATVKVTEEVPLIKAVNGDVATTLNRQQVSQVPNPGNDITYIVQLAPGVLMNTSGGTAGSGNGNFSVLGMPGTSNLFTLNGMDDNNLANTNLNGAANMTLGSNEIQEVTVVSNGYSGQFGSLAGSNVNYITRSGGNDLHGNAVYFWNGRVMNANDWINNATGTPRPFDNANQWAGSLGGPIKKDKLFFFFNTEGLRLLLPSSFQVVLPSPQFEAATIVNIDSRFGPISASDAFYKQMFNLYNATQGANAATPGNFNPRDSTGCTGFVGPNGLGTTVPCALHFQTTRAGPTSESLQAGRVDWNVGNIDRTFLQVEYDHGHQATWIDPISPLFNAQSSQPWWQAQLIETHTFGPSTANQFIVAGAWFSFIFREVDPLQALAAFPTTLGFANGAFTQLGGADFAWPSGKKVTQYQLSDDVTKMWGNHKIGFGGEFRRDDISDFQNGFLTTGYLTPLTLDAFYQGGVDPGVLNGTDPNHDFTMLSQNFAAHIEVPLALYNLGLYVQDEWHARSNLTLTLALRAEHQSNPVCQDRCVSRLTGPFDSVTHDPNQPYNQAIRINLKQALQELQGIAWQPRFSFAWQPFGVSHKTVLRGGIGIFYDTLPGLLAQDFSSNPPLVNSFTIIKDALTPNEITNLFKDAAASNVAFVNGFAAGQTLAQIQAVISSSYPPGFSPPGLYASDRRTFSPQYQKWSLEVQQSFGAHTSLNVGYYGLHGIHELIFNPSANAFGFGTLPPGLCASPPVLPCSDARFSQVTEVTTAGVSNYNGMVVSFQRQFSGWTQGLFQANYTYGHAFDEVSNGGLNPFTFGSSLNPQDPNNFRGAYGPAEYDVRQGFNANYIWEVPVKVALRGHGPDFLVAGWQVSGTVFAHSGFPYTVFDSLESGILNVPNNFFGSLYAVPVGPVPRGKACGEGAAIPSSPNPCQPPQLLASGAPNPNARFVQATCETGFNTGTLPSASGKCGGSAVALAQGRNQFRGPGYFDTDYTVMKNTKIPGWEKAQLGIGVQFFNFFNHPNFGLPDNRIADSTFGEILNMVSPPTSIVGSGLGGDASARMIQLKAQLQF